MIKKVFILVLFLTTPIFAYAGDVGCGLSNCNFLQGARVDAKAKKIVFKILARDCNGAGIEMFSNSTQTVPTRPPIEVAKYFRLSPSPTTQMHCPYPKAKVIEHALDLPDVKSGTVAMQFGELLLTYSAEKLENGPLKIRDLSKEKGFLPAPTISPVEEPSEGIQ